jgi:preprotein translocase subunit SecE
MARQGMDPNAPGGGSGGRGRAKTGNGSGDGGGRDRGGAATRNRAPLSSTTERTTPRQYMAEVRREMRMVAWPTRSEVINSSLVVLFAVIIMTSLIFAFDWMSAHAVLYLFG